MTNYYLWNVEALSDWIKFEISIGKEPSQLANDLDVSRHILREWQIRQSMNITLEQIEAIARCRGWGFDRTIDWLEICPEHLEELRTRLEP